mgnify:CR=1 FL=1
MLETGSIGFRATFAQSSDTTKGKTYGIDFGHGNVGLKAIARQVIDTIASGISRHASVLQVQQRISLSKLLARPPTYLDCLHQRGLQDATTLLIPSCV